MASVAMDDHISCPNGTAICYIKSATEFTRQVGSSPDSQIALSPKAIDILEKNPNGVSVHYWYDGYNPDGLKTSLCKGRVATELATAGGTYGGLMLGRSISSNCESSFPLTVINRVSSLNVTLWVGSEELSSTPYCSTTTCEVQNFVIPVEPMSVPTCVISFPSRIDIDVTAGKEIRHTTELVYQCDPYTNGRIFSPLGVITMVDGSKSVDLKVGLSQSQLSGNGIMDVQLSSAGVSSGVYTGNGSLVIEYR